MRVRLADVLSEPLINGRSVRSMDGGFPVLRLTALKRGGVDLSEHKSGAWSEEEATPFLVSEGDFLLSRGNGSRSLVGRGATVKRVTFPVAFPDTMIRVRVRPSLVLSEYLEFVWGSTIVRNQIEDSVRTTAGIYKINQKILEGMEIPVPPLDEQRRIVGALDAYISRLDMAERGIELAQLRAVSLRKALLYRAFTGGLVPQDPNEEAASLLFDRLRAERQADDNPPKRVRRARKKGAEAGPVSPPAPSVSMNSTPHVDIQQEFEL
ncbi:restriction endonuclease subunit S [Streptomyces sp. NPDC058195]|uniref:restriction endonuclease subunit S n=1 Tax=Streptomyces sp. NPDC058195 TaxID=3346375 RepID=UPI0036E3A575